MKSKFTPTWLFVAALAFNPFAYADEEETMDIIEEGETLEEFVEHVAPNDSAMFGTDVSNMARDPDAEYQGREFGQWVSGQVRQDVGQDLQQEAQRNARADARGDNRQGGRPD